MWFTKTSGAYMGIDQLVFYSRNKARKKRHDGWPHPRKVLLNCKCRSLGRHGDLVMTELGGLAAEVDCPVAAPELGVAGGGKNCDGAYKQRK